MGVRNYSKLNDQKIDTERRYHAALELYRTTDMPVTEICERTNTPSGAFRSYLRRCHRELMFARYGIDITPEEAASARLRRKNGQTAVAHTKYRDAIAACDDTAYIGYNVSQIAHIFNLNPVSLGQQLRMHFPDIIKRREKERHRLGVNDNLQRGMKTWCRVQYAEAVKHLKNSDDTIRQTAREYNLSYTGLREHLLNYHKDVVRLRAERRRNAAADKRRGALTGNGLKHEPSPDIVKKYRNPVRLYRTTGMTLKEIAAATGVTVNGLRNHLRTWYPDLVTERRGTGNCNN